MTSIPTSKKTWNCSPWMHAASKTAEDVAFECGQLAGLLLRLASASIVRRRGRAVMGGFRAGSLVTIRLGVSSHRIPASCLRLLRV